MSNLKHLTLEQLKRAREYTKNRIHVLHVQSIRAYRDQDMKRKLSEADGQKERLHWIDHYIAEKELTMPKRGDTHISDAIEQYHEEEKNMRQNERYIALATGLFFAGFVLLGVAWAVIQ